MMKGRVKMGERNMEWN